MEVKFKIVILLDAKPCGLVDGY